MCLRIGMHLRFMHFLVKMCMYYVCSHCQGLGTIVFTVTPILERCVFRSFVVFNFFLRYCLHSCVRSLSGICMYVAFLCKDDQG